MTSQPTNTISQKFTITEFIADDIRGYIESGQLLPSSLTLTGLAKHYNASFTPVKGALRILVNEGLIEQLANGRLALKSSPVKIEPGTKHHRKIPVPIGSSDRDGEIARHLILRSLRGDTGYIREEAAAKEFGLGRTAIRQVFSRLVGQGILIHIPRMGWQVCRINVDDLRAYCEVREALELTALNLAQHKLESCELARIRDGNIPGTEPLLNNDLHSYIVQCSDNHYIKDFFDRCGLFYATLFDYAAPEACVVSEMAVQHMAILNSLIAEDYKSARRQLAEHIRLQLPIVEKMLESLHKKNLRTTQE